MKYSIVDYNTNKKFEAKYPKQAAEKIFRFLYNKEKGNLNKIKNNKNNSVLVFTIKNQNNKLYKYSGKKVKLAKPITKYIKDKPITITHKNIISVYDI